MPVGSDRDERLAMNFWSSLNARSAAFIPAESPSKVKITSPGERVGVLSSRRITDTLLGAERGAAGGHRGRDAGKVAGHDVGSPRRSRAMLAGDVLLGHVDAVEQLALLVDRRVRGVEVLRVDLVVVEQPPRAKPTTSR